MFFEIRLRLVLCQFPIAFNGGQYKSVFGGGDPVRVRHKYLGALVHAVLIDNTVI
jgi:hypothetical protein